MEKIKFGKRIIVEEAQDYFNAFENVHDGTVLSLKPVSQITPLQQQHLDVSKIYNLSEKNAFIFDKQTIETLLNTENKHGETADFLMVHFAAKLKDGADEDGTVFKSGEPTLVVFGCKRQTKDDIEKYNNQNKQNIPLDADLFTSMDFDKPLAENPGGRSISLVPEPSFLGEKVIGVILKTI